MHLPFCRGLLALLIGFIGAVLQAQETWQVRPSGVTNKLWSVTYAANQWVAVGEQGTILTSPDGLGWTRDSIERAVGTVREANSFTPPFAPPIIHFSHEFQTHPHRLLLASKVSEEPQPARQLCALWLFVGSRAFGVRGRAWFARGLRPPRPRRVERGDRRRKSQHFRENRRHTVGSGNTFRDRTGAARERSKRSVCALLSGCATIVKGTTEIISVSSDPTGARVTGDNAPAGTTPTTVTLSRKQNHRVVIEKEGIPPAGTHLPKLNG